MRSLKFPDDNKDFGSFTGRINAIENNMAAANNNDNNNDEKWSPEQLYQELKKRWYLHPYSWYMLQETVDLKPQEYSITCSGMTGCIKECRFYEPEGGIEESELQQMIRSLEEFVKWKQTPCNPETCSMHPDHKHKDNKAKQEVEEKKEDNNNNNG